MTAVSADREGRGPVLTASGVVLTGEDRDLPGRFLTLLLRRPVGIIATATIIVLCAGAYNVVHGPRYTASMRLLVSPATGAVALPQPEDDAQSASWPVPDHGQAARNLAALLNDPGLVARLLAATPVDPHFDNSPVRGVGALGRRVRKLAERAGLRAPLVGDNAAMARVSRAFSAMALGDTDVLQLDLTWDDPRFAAAALGAIAAGAERAVSGAGEARAALARARTGLTEAQAELDALDTPTLAAGAAGPALAPQPAGPASAAGSLGPVTAEETARPTAMSEVKLAAESAAADQIRLALELARRGLAATDTAYAGGGWVAGGEGGKLAQKFAGLLEQKQALAGAGAPDVAASHAIDTRIAQVREQNYRRVRAHYTDDAAAQMARLALAEASLDVDRAALLSSDAQATRVRLVAQSRVARTDRLARARARVRAAELRLDGV